MQAGLDADKVSLKAARHLPVGFMVTIDGIKKPLPQGGSYWNYCEGPTLTEQLAAAKAENARLTAENNDVVVLQYEKRVLASYLGMTPENLSRSFASLADYGVTTQSSSIKIGDYNKLWQFASPSPLIDRHEPLLQSKT